MAYERRLGWRKLPTEVFVCAKQSLRGGVSTPHPLHPTYTTLSRYTFLHPVPVVRPEGSQTPLVVTYPWSQKMKHWQLAPPPCGMPDPGVRPKSVAQLLSIGVRRDILMFSMLINLLLLLRGSVTSTTAARLTSGGHQGLACRTAGVLIARV